jgi:hypothetical protein
MTAVGLLCRLNLGWSPRKKQLVQGVEFLEKSPPGTLRSAYYNYYASQVIHRLGGDHWKKWNEKIDALLLKSQDKGADGKHNHQKGSWTGKEDTHGESGGRLMQTSLSLLILEMPYRKRPLYRSNERGK